MPFSLLDGGFYGHCAEKLALLCPPLQAATSPKYLSADRLPGVHSCSEPGRRLPLSGTVPWCSLCRRHVDMKLLMRDLIRCG